MYHVQSHEKSIILKTATNALQFGFPKTTGKQKVFLVSHTKLIVTVNSPSNSHIMEMNF